MSEPGLDARSDQGSNRVRPMPTVSLTYPELATRLGRSEDAVKSLVKRKRWRRSIGNDGLARVTLDDAERHCWSGAGQENTSHAPRLPSVCRPRSAGASAV